MPVDGLFSLELSDFTDTEAGTLALCHTSLENMQGALRGMPGVTLHCGLASSRYS